jgi:hypothetical protein
METVEKQTAVFPPFPQPLLLDKSVKDVLITNCKGCLDNQHTACRPYKTSICLRTQTDEFKQARGGAENNAANQTPGFGTEPFVEEPAQGTKTRDCREQRNACRISEAGLSILVLVRFISHEVTNFRASGSSWGPRKARRDASGAWSRE